jgi:hypothetical protein
VLAVRLREHHQLDVGRIAAELAVRAREVLDLVGREREAELAVGALDFGDGDRRERRGLRVLEQRGGLLEAADVRKRYGDFTALDGVSLAIRAGEFVSIIGPNGAGKTTLVNVLSGRLAPTSGTVRFKGRDVGGIGPMRLARLGMARGDAGNPGSNQPTRNAGIIMFIDQRRLFPITKTTAVRLGIQGKRATAARRSGAVTAKAG